MNTWIKNQYALSNMPERYMALTEAYQTRNTRKRRKLSRRSTRTSAPSVNTKPDTGSNSSKSLFGPLLEVISSVSNEEDMSFDEFVEPLLPDLIDASAMTQVEKIQYDKFVSACAVSRNVLSVRCGSEAFTNRVSRSYRCLDCRPHRPWISYLH